MSSRGLKLLTMLVIPFSLCSARLQVFVFMTIALFEADKAPMVLFSMYLMSFIVVFITYNDTHGKRGSTQRLIRI